MNIINDLIQELKGVVGINNEYIILIIISLLCIIIIKFINKLINRLFSRSHYSSREIFRFNQYCNVIANIIIVFCIFIIWEKHLNNIVTIISFISAGATIALREVILNLFAGIYIKFAHPFVVEDRISIDDIKGDVVLIGLMSFKVLELGNRVNGDQSKGVIVNIPSSKIFSGELKNYTTAFKYIWTEMIIKIDFAADLEQNKKKIYEIVNKNAVIKATPKKMDRAIDDASGDYRIYYNNLTPIIYTEYVDDHIEFTLRFLVHPKKERGVIDSLWTEIIKEAQKGKIDLYKKS